MRIGIDIRLRHESGVGRYIRNLVAGLQAVDRRNEYILLDPKVQWHTLREQLILPAWLRRKQLDMIHFPYFNVPLFYFGKFVVTIHDLTISNFSTGKASTLSPLVYGWKRIGYKLVLWNALMRAKRIIVPTRAVKEDILRAYHIRPEKIAVIYEGGAIRLTKPVTGFKQAVTSKQYFLYVGNAYPHKNLDRLILAYVKAMRQLGNPGIKLVLAGRNDFFYKRLRKQVGRGEMGKRIIFTGWIDDAELGWWYRNALALVFPSLSEGFGLPAVEAMQNGCLVLASDIPALREVCRNAAVYFNPYRVDSIALRLRKVAQNPQQYQAKINRGKKRARRFSWEKMAQQTAEVYLAAVE